VPRWREAGIRPRRPPFDRAPCGHSSSGFCSSTRGVYDSYTDKIRIKIAGCTLTKTHARLFHARSDCTVGSSDDAAKSIGRRARPQSFSGASARFLGAQRRAVHMQALRRRHASVSAFLLPAQANGRFRYDPSVRVVASRHFSGPPCLTRPTQRWPRISGSASVFVYLSAAQLGSASSSGSRCGSILTNVETRPRRHVKQVLKEITKSSRRAAIVGSSQPLATQPTGCTEATHLRC